MANVAERIAHFQVTDDLTVEVHQKDAEEEVYPYEVCLVHRKEDKVTTTFSEEHGDKPDATMRFIELIEVLTAVERGECE
jgi:hypothetical protein